MSKGRLARAITKHSTTPKRAALPSGDLLLNERGALITRALEDGRVIDLFQQLFNWKLTISTDLESEACTDFWEYATFGAAIRAFAFWNPDDQAEPDGWIRNFKTARRRPDGDASREYVAE